MVNKAIIVGHLGREPETRHTQSGMAVCNFSVATNHKVKDEKQTEWHKIVAWGKLAEICGEYLTKGSLVYVEGRLQTRQWDDKDGKKQQTTEIVASEMRMLGGKGEKGGQEQPQAPQDAQSDDIPF